MMRPDKNVVIKKMTALLTQDSRAPLCAIGTQLNVPKSTIYDYLKEIRKKYWFTIVEKTRKLPENLDIGL